MRKRRYIFILLSIPVMMLLSSVVYGIQNQWSMFEKIAKNLYVLDGQLIELPSEEDKQKIIAAIDPVTGLSSESVSTKLHSNKITNETKSILFNLDNSSYSLEFDYVIHEDNIIVLPKFNNKPQRGYSTTRIPGTNQFVLEHQHSLYKLDIENSSITKLLLDKVNGYEYETTIQKGIENELLIRWGTNPSISLDGSKMIFFTNRGYTHGDLEAELWVKDLKSGEENAIFKAEQIREIMGWDPEYHVYVDVLNGIIRLNVLNGEVEYIVRNEIMDAAFSFPYLASQTDEGIIHIINVKSGDSKKITGNNLGFARRIILSPDSRYILIINAPDRTKIDRTVMLFDIESEEIREWVAPENYFIEHTEWIDENQLMINISKQETQEIESLLIDVSTIKNSWRTENEKD